MQPKKAANSKLVIINADILHYEEVDWEFLFADLVAVEVLQNQLYTAFPFKQCSLIDENSMQELIKRTPQL